MPRTKTSAGYSGTPLARKLGLKDGQTACFIALPDELGWLATARDFRAVRQVDTYRRLGKSPADVVHGFFTKAEILAKAAPLCMSAVAPDGMFWVSWPKKASGRATDLTEDVIREIALPIGLVDVKVCAVDDVWSGLKLMIRKELRR
jgi:hypothetical protein